MVQKDVVSKFCLERSYRIIYPGFDGEISVLAPLKRGGGGYPWYPVWRKCYPFNWLKNCTGLIIFCYTKFGRIFTLVKGWHASREKLSYLKHKRDIKSLDYRIVSLFLSIYLFIFILRKQFLISHSQTEINRIQTTLQKNHYPNTHLKP